MTATMESVISGRDFVLGKELSMAGVIFGGTIAYMLDFTMLEPPEHTHIPVSRRTPYPAGVGVGWNEDEATDHAVDLRRRRALVREQILAMQRPWSDEVASFEGELVHLPTRRSSVARSKPGRTRATRPLDSAISSGSAATGAAPTITLALIGRLRYGRSCFR